jgi:branched-chain amino acid transport system substrate-binding protein
LKQFVLRAAAASAISLIAGGAFADDVVQIANINPTSGPAAAVTERIFANLKYVAGQVNAADGLDGKKVEIVNYDNKLSPQETVVQAQKAIDSGARILLTGVSSPNVIALADFVNKHNARHPDQKALVFDVASGDPVVTATKCSPWVFQWVLNTDQQILGLADYLKSQSEVKKVYLLNPDSSSGQSVRRQVLKVFKDRLPRVQFTGDESQPLLRITDYAPYIAKIKASGADTVVTADWGQDLALLLKAAGEAGLKVKWFTIYTTGPGAPTAIKQAGLDGLVYSVFDGDAGVSNAEYEQTEAAVRKASGFSAGAFPGSVNMMHALKQAADETKSADPVKLATALAGSKFKTLYGAEATARAEDHQLIASVTISLFGALKPGDKFDEEGTGWGWRTVATVPASVVNTKAECKAKNPS